METSAGPRTLVRGPLALVRLAQNPAAVMRYPIMYDISGHRREDVAAWVSRPLISSGGSAHAMVSWVARVTEERETSGSSYEPVQSFRGSPAMPRLAHVKALVSDGPLDSAQKPLPEGSCFGRMAERTPNALVTARSRRYVLQTPARHRGHRNTRKNPATSAVIRVLQTPARHRGHRNNPERVGQCEC